MRLAFKGLALVWLLTGIQACTTLGPDYQEPEVVWLDQWQTDLYGQVLTGGSPEQDLAFWWQAFNDPVLNDLIEEARRESPSLRIAALAILESQALLGIATGLQYPQVQQLSGSLARADTWPTEGPNSGERSSLNSYNLGFDVAWEADFWGRYRRSIESADAAFFASVSNYNNAQVLLAAQVAEAYYAYRTAIGLVEIAYENAKLQKRSLEITTRLYERGQSAELDLQQAKTQYLATLSSIPSLEISQTQFANALAVLLGRQPGDLPEIASLSTELPTLNPVLIDSVPAHLLMRRPDVRAAAQGVAAQSAQVGVARTDLYPSISLFGSIAWGGTSSEPPYDGVTTAFGPRFSWNLFQYDRLKNNVRVQDARLQQAIEGYQLTVLAAAAELDNAAISVVKTQEQGKLLADALAAADRSLALSTKRYQEGYSDFQRVLSAQEALAARSSSYVSNQGAHINGVIAFYKAVGGGWQPATTEDLIPETIRQVMQERTDWGNLLETPSQSSHDDQELEEL